MPPGAPPRRTSEQKRPPPRLALAPPAHLPALGPGARAGMPGANGLQPATHRPSRSMRALRGRLAGAPVGCAPLKASGCDGRLRSLLSSAAPPPMWDSL
eukprot:scaffold17460_cov128-Isochrysis_galbana.AAC.8